MNSKTKPVSTKALQNPFLRRLALQLQALAPAQRLLIAYSGGRDSHVLLHALHQLHHDIPLQAVHIHHGLQSEADQWVAHCRCVCEALAVPLEVVHVQAQPGPGESPEAVAREARYQAFARLIKTGDMLLTAHHQEDQAETLLLQLLRGAGPAGLAAMANCMPFAKAHLARPLLGFDQQAIAQYATAWGLGWIEDPSNQALGFDRNYLRHQLMPVIRQRWPGAAQTLHRAAAHQAQAQSLLNDLADLDLTALANASDHSLSVAALRQLTSARQGNCLRRWLVQQGFGVPPQARLEAIITQVLEADVDSTPLVVWDNVQVRRYRDRLYAMAPLTPHDPTQIIAWDVRQPLVIAHLGITLQASDVALQGLRLVEQTAPISVRFRSGGEYCHAGDKRPGKTLKKRFQEAGIPPWQRERVPLIYAGDTLVAVWGQWTSAPAGLALDEGA